MKQNETKNTESPSLGGEALAEQRDLSYYRSHKAKLWSSLVAEANVTVSVIGM